MSKPDIRVDDQKMANEDHRPNHPPKPQRRHQQQAHHHQHACSNRNTTPASPNGSTLKTRLRRLRFLRQRRLPRKAADGGARARPCRHQPPLPVGGQGVRGRQAPPGLRPGGEGPHGGVVRPARGWDEKEGL